MSARRLSQTGLAGHGLSSDGPRAVIGGFSGSASITLAPRGTCYEVLTTCTVTVLVAGWVDAVLQAGGGGYQGAGGGAGGHAVKRIWLPEGTHDLVIGTGGAPGSAGGDTYIDIAGLVLLAKGGGYGAVAWNNGGPGGSGGGAANTTGGVVVYPGQGYPGGGSGVGTYSGGGGAGGPGAGGGTGGPGVVNDYTGVVRWYAAGGGGTTRWRGGTFTSPPTPTTGHGWMPLWTRPVTGPLAPHRVMALLVRSLVEE